jgi:hypothetical protein
MGETEFLVVIGAFAVLHAIGSGLIYYAQVMEHMERHE